LRSTWRRASRGFAGAADQRSRRSQLFAKGVSNWNSSGRARFRRIHHRGANRRSADKNVHGTRTALGVRELFAPALANFLRETFEFKWISLGIARPDALIVRGPDWNWIRRRTLVGPAGDWPGLAITALSVGLLHKHQHEAQALSLAVTALPLTLPAAWVCAGQGFRLPWVPITFLLVGLPAGGWVGSVFANRLTERNLKMCVRVLLAVTACYMAARAIRS
jgi:hypothetical protein